MSLSTCGGYELPSRIQQMNLCTVQFTQGNACVYGAEHINIDSIHISITQHNNYEDTIECYIIHILHEDKIVLHNQ